jgi:hypothetical protein
LLYELQGRLGTHGLDLIFELVMDDVQLAWNEEATETMTTCKICQKAEENGGATAGAAKSNKEQTSKRKRNKTKQNKIK